MIATSFPEFRAPDGRASARQLRRRGAGRGRMIIAIDGPAASGKGTLAKRIADHFGLPCLDTGLLYRAVARDVRGARHALDDAAAAAAAARAPRSRDARRSRPARRRRRRGRLHRRRASRRCAPPCSTTSAPLPRSPEAPCSMAAISAPSSAPTPTLRFSSPPRPKCAPGAGFCERTAPRRAASPTRPCWPISAAATSATPAASSAPMRPAADADLLDTSNLDIEAAFDAAVGVIKRKIGQAGAPEGRAPIQVGEHGPSRRHSEHPLARAWPGDCPRARRGGRGRRRIRVRRNGRTQTHADQEHE